MKNLYKLKKYFARYKSKLLWGFLFILLSNAGTVLLPILLKDAINVLEKVATTNDLIFYGTWIIITSLVAGIFRFLIRQTIIVVSREIEYDLRHDFWERGGGCARGDYTAKRASPHGPAACVRVEQHLPPSGWIRCKP